MYLEIRTQSPRTALTLLQMPIICSRSQGSPGCPKLLADLATNRRFSRLPPLPQLGLVNLLEWLPELRETLMFMSLLKDMIKDTDEHPEQEIHTARSGRFLRSEALRTPHCWDFRKAPPVGMIDY